MVSGATAAAYDRGMEYITDLERAAPARTTEEISGRAWGGIASLIEQDIAAGAFAEDFPIYCNDGTDIEGTHRTAFFNALLSEIPDLEDELVEVGRNSFRFGEETPPDDALVALDVVQFCYQHVSKPLRGRYHEWFNHHHLEFDRDAGRDEFRDLVNRIFRRNGIVFELESDGKVRRVIPVEMRRLYKGSFVSPDVAVNKLMKQAMKAFRDPDLAQRERAVEKLWDAWERLKTLQGNDKKSGLAELLDRASHGHAAFRQTLEDEARALTNLGNDYRIRHHEVDKVALDESSHLGYVFYRMLSLLGLLVRHAG